MIMLLYEGPSLIDGSPIVCIALEDSNPKTGRMLFTWILRQDRPPEVAAYDGSDAAICGDCKFRAQLEPPLIGEELTLNPTTRTCYVRLGADADEAVPPSEVWRRWKDGEFRVARNVELSARLGATVNYYGEGGPTEWTWGDFAWRYRGPLPVRIGSYGDPAAVPTRVWAELVRHARSWTGYTHLWQPKKCMNCNGHTYVEAARTWPPPPCKSCNQTGRIDRCDPELKRYCMASVNTPEERDEAQALGWRTFLVVPEDQTEEFSELSDWDNAAGFQGDILCPATSPHPKHNTTCSTCMMCMGTSAKMTKSIWEVVHGKNAANHKW